MKKLLHERLREYDREGCTGRLLAKVIGCEEPECIGFSCGGCIDALLDKVADEIERYYIPRPRFEDGEPVCTGTRAMTRTGKEGIVVRFECNYGSEVLDTIVKCENGEEDRADVIVKRPQPKVLDADGVEINVGDTVYDKFRGCAFRVEEIDFNHVSSKVIGFDDDNDKCIYCADQLTHKEPILDADGVPINVGDTVWHITGSKPWTVIEASDWGVLVRDEEMPCGDGGSIFSRYDLTHKEPDSLEKLRDDMKAWLEEPPMEAEGIAIGKWRDRLSALIERSA